MDQVEFYFDVNNDKTYNAETDISVSYSNGKIVFPLETGKVPVGESRVIRVKAKNSLSLKTYGTRNSADSEWHDILYLNGKDSQTGWFTFQQDEKNYNVITDNLEVTVRPLSNPANLSAGLAISRYKGVALPVADEKVFDMAKIDFYLDADGNGSFSVETDIVIEYKDSKLVLPDRSDIVPFGEYRQVLMKSKLSNSLRTYGFKQGDNNIELVFANLVLETSDTNGAGDAWYRRYPNNKLPQSMYMVVVPLALDITVTITSKETVLPIRSSTVTNQGAPIEELEFYVDRDNNQEFTEGDNSLEYVENNGIWNIALPDKVTNNISVPTGQFRRVMIKPYDGKTYHFVAAPPLGTDPQNLGGYKSIVLRPDTDSNRNWLLASSATSSFGIGVNLVYVRIVSLTGEIPRPLPPPGIIP